MRTNNKRINQHPLQLVRCSRKSLLANILQTRRFLSHGRIVHKENEILKHHEMRIRAKWLRYTLEVFAPLYEEELSEEIKMMKNFQDTLGEMHDCDVWIEGIPKFIEETRRKTAIIPENEQAAADQRPRSS